MERVNVELKARDPDPAATAARCIALGAANMGVLDQRDTYFAARTGRLKLREERGGDAGAQLIAYRRRDAAEPEQSAYVLAAASEPDALREALDGALGTSVVVAKRRRLFLWEHVRIHLDEVERLGTFIELEALVGPGLDRVAEAQEKVARLRSELAIEATRSSQPGTPTCCSTRPTRFSGRPRRRCARAYAPYSEFKVGAAVRGAAARSTPARTSRTPPTRRASAPRPRRSACSSPPARRRSQPWRSSPSGVEHCPPCGGCRQRLAEFGTAGTPVYLGRPGAGRGDDARRAPADVVRTPW